MNSATGNPIFLKLFQFSDTAHHLRFSKEATVLTIESVDLHHHFSFPLIGCPLELTRRMLSAGRGGELEGCEKLVLAQRAVLPWTPVRHIPDNDNIYYFSFCTQATVVQKGLSTDFYLLINIQFDFLTPLHFIGTICLV